MTRYDSVAQHAFLGESEIGRTVGHEPVELHKGSGIHQEIDALPRGQLALVVLPLDPILTAAKLGLGSQAMQLIELLL